MPTYQYRCTECGRDLEAVQKFSDPALTECTTCGGSLRKVFNAVGVVFKGSGFYRTDSRAGASTGKGDAGSGDSGSSDGAKTETTKTPSEKSGDSNGKPAEKVAASAGNGSASSSGKPKAEAGTTSRSR